MGHGIFGESPRCLVSCDCLKAIAISDQSYSNIAGEGKKVSLTVKTAEDGSATEIIELTDDLNELIGGFTSSGEGTAEATIHYVTDENCAATLLELKSPIKGSPRRIADYTEDIYIIDLNGDGQDVKILSNFAFSETFTNRVSGFNPIYARNQAPLGVWTKKLLKRGFNKVVTFVTSKNPWSIAINVVASYAIGGMIEYWVGDHEGLTDAFYAHVIKEGFRGALANLVGAYGEGLASTVITTVISYIIKTPFDQFDAKVMIIEVAVGTVLGLITTNKNGERLGKVVGNVTRFTKDLIKSPNLIAAFLENNRLVKVWKILDDGGTILRRNIVVLDKIEFLKFQKGLTDVQLTNIGKLNDIKAIDLVSKLAKRSNPSITDKVLKELDEIAIFAKDIEIKFKDSKIFDDLTDLVSDPKYHNVNDLREWLKASKGNSGASYKLELSEAKGDLSKGNTISLGKKNQFDNELDVVSESGKWVKECKRLEPSSKKRKAFNDNLKKIGLKFNDDKKLNLGERDFYKQNGGLIGVIEITNSSHPFYGVGKGNMGPHIQGIINGLDEANVIKQGLKNMKELIIISGNQRIILENGKDFL